LTLSDWLQEGDVTHVAMESTGIYWRPIFNILEGSFQLLLVNAQHIKFVPGRKTDVKDAQWIAELLQHGLLKPSYIPAAPQRTLRELLKYRQYLTQGSAVRLSRSWEIGWWGAVGWGDEHKHPYQVTTSIGNLGVRQ
jgi:transposase